MSVRNVMSANEDINSKKGQSSTSHKIQHIAKSNATEKTSINEFILQYIAFSKIPKAGGEGNIPSLFLATDS